MFGLGRRGEEGEEGGWREGMHTRNLHAQTSRWPTTSQAPTPEMRNGMWKSNGTDVMVLG